LGKIRGGQRRSIGGREAKRKQSVLSPVQSIRIGKRNHGIHKKGEINEGSEKTYSIGSHRLQRGC